MKLSFEVEVNLDGLQEKLEDRFAINSPAQIATDETIWLYMIKYIPYDTEAFLEHNRNLNQQRLGSGEIIFEADPESGYPYQAVWLFTGRSQLGERFISRYTNPLSTAYWDRTLVANDMPLIESEIQSKIDRGEI